MGSLAYLGGLIAFLASLAILMELLGHPYYVFLESLALLLLPAFLTVKFRDPVKGFAASAILVAMMLAAYVVFTEPLARLLGVSHAFTVPSLEVLLYLLAWLLGAALAIELWPGGGGG